MKNAEDKTQSAYIIVKENNVVAVSDAFISLSGFTECDILGKPLYIVWNDQLRISIDLRTIETQKEVFLFTKSL
ncbi:MAG TPA: hypothetical protein VD757_02475, partial [Candidatus Nitrosocosmicus sp.]|nr:hypothetical protein [Candidatus Nitrosocosmicus sp.]